MAQTMICLVSEQRMQNIIPCLQQGMEIGNVWLVRSSDADTPQSRYAQAWRDTIATLGGIVQSAEPSVGAYGIAETQAIISRLVSVGAYLAAHQAGVNALYVDTANEKVVWFFPNGEVREDHFALSGRLTVEIYFKASGKQVDAERTRQQQLPSNTIELARVLLARWPSDADALEQCGRKISQGDMTLDWPSPSSETIQLLQQYRMIRRANAGWETTQATRPFLTGKWLEAIVYVQLLDSGAFDDTRMNVCVHGIENELDVTATRNGQLAIIECKSGELGGATILNKLQAIRTGFGTFARSLFVSSRPHHQIDEQFRNRAKDYGVRQIITRETLTQAAEIVKNGMRGTP